MNDDFVGDIGDYSKYGLLRALNQVGGFRLGIVWMKTKAIARHSRKPVEQRETFKYLYTSVRGNESLFARDPKLYRILKSLVDDGMRTIAGLEASHALPAGTAYFDELLDFGSMPAVGKKALKARLLFREEWFRRALNALQATELVFFDPDNGLETPSKKRHRADGPRYVWYDELEPFLDREKSLIVYQHGNREKGGAEQVIKRRACDLRSALKCERIWAVQWHRVQSRVYFLIPATEHIARMEQAIRGLKASRWCRGGLFTVGRV